MSVKDKFFEVNNMNFTAGQSAPIDNHSKAVSDMQAMRDLFKDEPTHYVPPTPTTFNEGVTPDALIDYSETVPHFTPQPNVYTAPKQPLMEKPVPAGAKFDPMTGKPLQPQWKFDPNTGKPIKENIEKKVIKESNGKWLLTRRNHNDGSSTYSVKHNITNGYIIENMECKEAGWCIMKLLNEGKAINQHPISNILEEERKIKQAQDEMNFMENRINIIHQKGQSTTLLESKFSKKEDQYQSAYNQIKKYKEEITRLK